MPKTVTTLPLGLINLDETSAQPLYVQIYKTLREAILSNQLAPGTRLPSSRNLAKELSVSRNTIINAFEQLLAEGYLRGKTGAGTYVAHLLPEDILEIRHAQGHAEAQSNPKPRPNLLSQNGQTLTQTTMPRVSTPVRAFRLLPALDAFPYSIWGKLVSQYWRKPNLEALNYSHPAGHPPLQEAVANYLRLARGVQCQAKQVIITAGAQQALDLVARILLDTGDKVWVENPGYLGARAVLQGIGAKLIPIPVDEGGLDVQKGQAIAQSAKLAYITPSHQYPLGVTMSLNRRLRLLQWAAENKAWILEDDYDSEYRYEGRPLAALQGLDAQGCVLYVGSFSKVLFPALRLGYVVVPPDLIAAFGEAINIITRCMPLVDQIVLTEFINSGHFARHIRRMRTLYAQRQAILLEAAQQNLTGLLDIKPAETGLHVVGWLPAKISDEQVAQALFKKGVEAHALSKFYLGDGLGARNGLVLGYAGLQPEEIWRGVKIMAEVLGH